MPEADRLRLAGRVPADYVGYGYAPLLADDMKAVAAVAGDVATLAAAVEADADAAAAAQAEATTQRLAAQSAAQAAGASVPATADRTVGRRASDTAIWSMIRSTPAWGFGPDGALVETPVDTLRWEFDRVTQAPLGVAFAGARTNQIRNPRAEGGASGSPGTAPANWVITNAPSGLTRTITTGISYKGMQGVRVRYAGTPAAPGAVSISFDANTAIPATPGQVWAGGFLWRLSAGSLAGVTQTRAQFGWRDSGGVSLGPTSIALTNGGGDNRFQGVGTAPASTAFSQLLMRFDFSAVALDFEVEIFIPDLELGPFASAPKLPAIGSPAASTRAQGTVTIPVQQLGARLSRRQGLIILDWNSQPGPFTSAAAADWFGLVSWGDTTADNRMGLLINPAHTSIEARCTAGGVVQTASAVTITAPTAGQTIRAALAWDLDAGFLQVAARGTAGSKVALTAVPAVLSHLMVGRYATSHPMFGRAMGLDARPGALFDAALAALT